ncbi:MAG: RDD family protein [Candidatus Latescibacteria bacterium]|nr:RDD family protein [Candidatus Latescibacterota bacterium]
MADDPPAAMRPVDAAGRIGFNRRFGAFAIDVIAVWILTSITGIVTGENGPEASSGLHHLSDLTRMMAGVGVIVSSVQLLYCLIEGLTGASPGKMVLRIHIRDASGAPAATGTLILRMAVKHIKVVATLLVSLTGSHLLTIVGLAGGVIFFFGCFLALGAARQALHDRILQTAVFATGTRD